MPYTNHNLDLTAKQKEWLLELVNLILAIANDRQRWNDEDIVSEIQDFTKSPEPAETIVNKMHKAGFGTPSQWVG